MTVFSTDHKVISLQYAVTWMAFLPIGFSDDADALDPSCRQRFPGRQLARFLDGRAALRRAGVQWASASVIIVWSASTSMPRSSSSSMSSPSARYASVRIPSRRWSGIFQFLPRPWWKYQQLVSSTAGATAPSRNSSRGNCFETRLNRTYGSDHLVRNRYSTRARVAPTLFSLVRVQSSGSGEGVP